MNGEAAIKCWTSRRGSIAWFIWTTTYTLPMRTSSVALDANHHQTHVWFTVTNSVWSVSLISLSAAQVILAKPIITWLLGIDEADDPEAIERLSKQIKSSKLTGQHRRSLHWLLNATLRPSQLSISTAPSETFPRATEGLIHSQ